MKDKVFGVLQRVGRSFMLPIALLPAAGLLLGIGSSFTNATMLQAYHLSGLIYPGSFLYTILDIMNQCGNVVFSNLALLFAMGVAIGMVKAEKEVAALAGAIAYLVMNTAIAAMITASGGVDAMPANTTTTMLGIPTLQMGVFGGILVGLGVAALHNRYYKIELPQVLSFFGGTRFVPIICTAAYVLVGVALFYVWPIVQNGIALLGALVNESGYAGTWIYGLIERLLIPFGLHHVFYIPFWQTSLGGTAVIAGTTVQGAQNIFFAELAAGGSAPFSVSATRFMAGKFPLMIFGLPGAALAMYHCARPEKRTTAGGLLLGAALTAMLTGITEPLEFTFLFVAPLLYGIHCVLAGLAYMLMHLLGVGVGMTFSGGLIDLTLFGILQGNAKTHWLRILPVGIVYFAIYYGIFRVLIQKFGYKTPGRESDTEQTRLYTRADYNEKTGKTADGQATTATDRRSAQILQGLGGQDNLADLDACATRLRVTVRDPSLVDEGLLKQSGASGVLRKGDGVQVIYGPQVSVVKSALLTYMESAPHQTIASTAPVPSPAPSSAPPKPESTLYAPMKGEVKLLCEVPDEAFSQGVMGQGIAFEPHEGKLYAPADGTIESVFETGHAITMTTDAGAELLLHVGLDTVKLGGAHFTPQVKEGAHVTRGTLLLTFDMSNIRKKGYPLITPLVVVNSEDYAAVEPRKTGQVTPSDPVVRLLPKSE